MKNLKIISLIAMLSINYSCDENIEASGISTLVKLEVRNNAKKNVTIDFYYSNRTLFKKVLINSQDSIVVEEGYLRPAPTGPEYSLTHSLDSAIIVFEDGKVLTQTFFDRGNNDTINNILISSNYKSFESFNPTFARLQFTLTQADYLRAK